MGSPIGKDFQAPLSPWTHREHSPRKRDKRLSGQILFEQVADFYAWYLSWVKTPQAHAKTFELLSRLMRIAQVSKDGGFFLSEEEEEKALKALSILRENLFDGLCRQHEIRESLLHMIQGLIAGNPKARLVARTNELEYILCIYAETSVEEKARYQRLFDEVLKKVTPSLLDIHAHAVSQGLLRIIEKPGAFENVEQAILKATEHWL